jgi:hypothetical protein
MCRTCKTNRRCQMEIRCLRCLGANGRIVLGRYSEKGVGLFFLTEFKCLGKMSRFMTMPSGNKVSDGISIYIYWLLDICTFCQHNVLTCFIWISEQTTIFPLHTENLFLITETGCVYCAVPTKPLNIINAIRRL